jgi:hypothetical protein
MYKKNIGSRWFGFGLIACLALVASACQRVQSEVTSFSSLSSSAYGEPFFVLPNEEQASSAEFMQYANSISRRLEQKGWYRVMDSAKAKYVVLLDYGVAGSSTKVGSVPVYGQTGGGSTSHSGTFNSYGGGYGSSYGTYSGTSYTMPTWGVVGSQSYSYTHHQRYFQMKVIDSITDTPVYETKAASEGSASNFGVVAECIFDMALADFPLQSSSSGSVLMDECGT